MLLQLFFTLFKILVSFSCLQNNWTKIFRNCRVTLSGTFNSVWQVSKSKITRPLLCCVSSANSQYYKVPKPLKQGGVNMNIWSWYLLSCDLQVFIDLSSIIIHYCSLLFYIGGLDMGWGPGEDCWTSGGGWSRNLKLLWPEDPAWYLCNICSILLLINDDQPKLRGSGVAVTLVCEYTRDPEGIWGVFQPKLVISRGAVKHWCTVWPQSSSSPTVHCFSLPQMWQMWKSFHPARESNPRPSAI